MKRLTLDLPSDVHRALKVRSAELDVAMSDLLRGLVADALKKPAILQAIAARLER